MRQVEYSLEERNEYDKADPAINDRWNTDEDFNSRTDDSFSELRCDLCHEYGSCQTERYGNDKCQCTGQDGTPDVDSCADLAAAHFCI